MSKIFRIFVFVCLCMLGVTSSVYAGVRFITDVPRNSFAGKAPSNPTSSTQNRCAAIGYRETARTCKKGTIPTNPCPYSGNYYKSCCDEEYRYTREYCLKRGLTPSSHSCEGKYACRD